MTEYHAGYHLLRNNGTEVASQITFTQQLNIYHYLQGAIEILSVSVHLRRMY